MEKGHPFSLLIDTRKSDMQFHIQF